MSCSIPPLHFFFLFWPLFLTMGGLRLLHIGVVGLLRVIAGPGAQKNMQISAVTWSCLKPVFHVTDPADAGRRPGYHRAKCSDQCYCLTFGLVRVMHLGPDAQLCGDLPKTVCSWICIIFCLTYAWLSFLDLHHHKTHTLIQVKYPKKWAYESTMVFQSLQSNHPYAQPAIQHVQNEILQ